MANLLKPSVDQAVFGHSSYADPVRRRSNRDHNVSFLGEDEAGDPVATKVAGVFRAVGTVAVLVAGLALTGRL
jgi:hypothetical protein